MQRARGAGTVVLIKSAGAKPVTLYRASLLSSGYEAGLGGGAYLTSVADNGHLGYLSIACLVLFPGC